MAASGGTKACRLCLIMDNELISIDMQLENSMRSILGQNITYESGLPKYACNNCAEFLRRFKEFREKCLIAQTVLYQILKSAGQVTDAEIRKLNRKRLKLDTQIKPVQEQDPQEITPADDMEEETSPLEDIPVVDVPCRPLTIKMELESRETDPMEESESENDDKSNVTFEAFEEESEVLLDTSNPLEEENTTSQKEVKGELILPPEHADLSEGFKIFLTPTKPLKVKFEADEAVASYHCERCCQASAGAPAQHQEPPEGPHGAGYCPFEFPTLEEYRSHTAQHRTYEYTCRRCSFSATDVETARNHRQQKHADKMYSCCYCNFRTIEPLQFLAHVRARHSLQLLCAACGRGHASAHGLRMHVGKLHNRKRTATNSIKFKSKTKKKIKKTTKKKVQLDPKLLCTKCRIQFSTAAAWRRHLDNNHIVYDSEEEKPLKAKKVNNYSLQTLQRAFEAVKSKEMGVRQASRFFKIPKSTLQGRLKHDNHRGKRGPPPIFNEEEEGILVEFVKSEGSLRPKAVKAEAALLAKRLKLDKFFKKGAPGPTWYANFIRRHPELKQYAK